MLAVMVSEWAQALARWGAFVATSLFVGLVVLGKVAPAFRTHALAIRLARGAGAALLVTAVVRLAQQSLSLAPSPGEAVQMLAVLLHMPWGIAWMVQVVAASLVAWVPMALLRRGLRGAGAVVALALCAVPAFQGHAIGSESLTTLAVAADVAHVVGSGLWMGTLGALVLVVMSRGGDDDLRAGIAAFSPIALTGAATLATTGALAAWMHVGTLPALWESPYGLMLVRKLVLVAAIGGIGAWNWKRLTPRLSSPGGAAGMRRSAMREVLLGALVLLLTAFLVATPLPGE